MYHSTETTPFGTVTQPDLRHSPEARLAVESGWVTQALVDEISIGMRQYNVQITAFAATSSRIAVADLFTLFEDVMAPDQFIFGGVAIDRVNPNTQPDHFWNDVIHPGTIGQALIANTFIDTIDARFGAGVTPLGEQEIFNFAYAVPGAAPGTVPEPSSLALMALGMLALVGYGWRRRRHDFKVRQRFHYPEEVALMSKARLLALAALAGLSHALAPAVTRAEEFTTTVVMSGLDNPRGLAFGPDGGLYVAEAGRGGAGPRLDLPTGETLFYGPSGAVSRLLGGEQQRVLTGLPSLAPANGGSARGLVDITFGPAGGAFGVIGFGGNPALRSNLGPVGADFGRLVSLPLTGGGPLRTIADLAAYEAAHDPDRNGPDSNPYRVRVTLGGFVAVDAGGNDVLGVTAGGAVSTLAVLPDRPNPLPFGPPFYQSVPTAVTLGPDGAYYVGQLTGVPFPPGAANVYRLDPVSGEVTVAYSGFTNIIDLTFGPDGSLYVLEISRDGLASPTGPAPGALIRVDPVNGARTTIASEGLVFPTGVVVGPDGSIYVSNFGTSAGGGEVIRLEPVPAAVPEPTSLALTGLGMVGLLAYAWRRKRVGGGERMA